MCVCPQKTSYSNSRLKRGRCPLPVIGWPVPRKQQCKQRRHLLEGGMCRECTRQESNLAKCPRRTWCVLRSFRANGCVLAKSWLHSVVQIYPLRQATEHARQGLRQSGTRVRQLESASRPPHSVSLITHYTHGTSSALLGCDRLAPALTCPPSHFTPPPTFSLLPPPPDPAAPSSGRGGTQGEVLKDGDGE